MVEDIGQPLITNLIVLTAVVSRLPHVLISAVSHSVVRDQLRET
jgi:hypothetical protein